MKTDRRHELQTNQLAIYLERLWSDLQQYSMAIVGTIVAVLVVIGAYVYLNNQAEANRAISWEELQLAGGEEEELDKVAQRYPDFPAGQWAKISRADQELSQGSDALFVDRAESNKALTKALELYQSIVKVTGSEPSLLAQRALLGQARTEEALGKLDAAQASYQKFAEQYPASPYLIEVERRLKDVSRIDTKKFYDWFANYVPKPPTEDSLLFPDQLPASQLNQLPEEPLGAESLGTESLEKAAGIADGAAPAEPPLDTAEATAPDTIPPESAAPEATPQSADEAPAESDPAEGEPAEPQPQP